MAVTVVQVLAVRGVPRMKTLLRLPKLWRQSV
jgi:hypothetical protein